MLPSMVSPKLPVADVLMYVVLQMAALAEGGQVVSVVVVAVAVEVGYGEHHSGDFEKPHPLPSHFF